MQTVLSAPVPERRNRWGALLGSAALHVAAIALIPAASNLASWLSYDHSERAADLEPLRLKTPFYFTPPKANSAPTPSPRRQADAALPRLARVLKRFDLPPFPHPPQEAPAIIQPDVRLQAVAPPKLPPLAFWARQNTAIPKPVHKQFVVPGRTEAPSPAPNLSAPPVLAIPNRETKVADINVALGKSVPGPKLPLPNSTTNPVRERGATGDPQAASFDPLQGQAANVVSLAPPRLGAQEVVTIPRGLENVPPGADGAPGKSVGSAANDGNGRSKIDRAAGGSGENAIAPAPRLIRMEHSPAGSFDVVITQSTARDDLPELGGILTGNPVYSVYLPVGDEKEWLLEYCVPTKAKPEVDPYQVDIGAPENISPPYPLLTVIPGSIVGFQHAKYIVLHGFLTAAGVFKEIKAPDSTSPLVRQVLPVLAQWRFRPAMKDREAIDVEVLLVVPPRS